MYGPAIIKPFTVKDMVTGEKHMFVITCCMEQTRDFSRRMSPEIRIPTPGAAGANRFD
jgi:hypothetical protein